LYADIHKFANAASRAPSRLREANQVLNEQLRGQQALVITQQKTIQDAQQMILEFKKMTEDTAKERLELLKVVDGLKANQEAEMTRLKVDRLHFIDERQ
jgi:hypothetical protein